MKNKLVQSLGLVSAVFMIVGCGGESNLSGTEELATAIELPANVQAAIDGESSDLTEAQELKDAITHMYSEEGLAHDLYLALYKEQAVIQLQNIATKSEVKHTEAVNQVAQKYDLNMTQYPDTDHPYSIEGIGNGTYPVAPVQNLYTTLYEKGISSRQNALEVGCTVEVVDIDDLNHYITLAKEANATDILTVFNFLRNGSYTHYWAFNDALVGMGVEEGCCQMAKDLGHTACPTYPRN
ncbi:DUF2202 domain-containing protein [Sulfurovum sp. TSL1]|uniref:DUF2202 domain-containing protein n=1 Tax=Sulfurovum sp. TSL1 TaxID=2826994 RepID=UPI001CC63AAB|nr:DUF2202 domain-containing protein [Sulfurovum sp. TSL1]GIT98661.1 hypothetical protein TSL1_14820 [Sulfurovum sp. TSL1]